MEDRVFAEEQWLELWNLYDYGCWGEFLQRDSFKNSFEKSEHKLREYIHNEILLPALDQLEENINSLEDQFKFLYWYKRKEEFRIITENYILTHENMDEVCQREYKTYLDRLDGAIDPDLYRPEYEYFKWFYVAIVSIKYTAIMFLNEILFSLPVSELSQNSQRANMKLEEKIEQQIINIYNLGSIDSIVNSIATETSKTSMVEVNQSHIVVQRIIENFKNQIENNFLFKLLYEHKDGKLRHENNAQMLFFSIAQIYCLANDLDVSPETNSGAGSVDFKFSKGFYSKVNVEIKYSSNPNLEHGLHTQLEKYNTAEQATFSYYLIIKVRDQDQGLIDKLLLEDKSDEHKNIIVVDGMYKKSASRK